MPPLAQARDFAARLRLVAPRRGRAALTGVFDREALPPAVREAFAAPPLPAYQGLAPFWDEHWSSIVPRYADYAATLLRAGALAGDGALDLACGSAIAAAGLAPRFRRVFALDASPDLLAQARARLAPFPNATCLEASFEDFTLPAPVALVVCAGNSLNYALTPRALQRAFACVSRALAPGGRFLFDLVSEASFAGASGLTFRYRLGAHEWWQAYACDPATGLDEARILTPRGVEHHRRRFIGPGEVEAAAAAAGLVVTGRFGHPLLRWLAGRRGWDFHELRAASAKDSASASPRPQEVPTAPPAAPPRW